MRWNYKSMLNQRVIINRGSDVKTYRKQWGLTTIKLCKLMGYRSRITLQAHERERYPLPERARKAYTLLFQSLEDKHEIAKIIRDTNVHMIEELRKGVEVGRLPKGIQAGALPSYKKVLELIRKLDGFI
jgi:hypothetical protein